MSVGIELRQWREGKVRPVPGTSPHDRLVSRVISSSLKERLRRSLPRHCFPQPQRTILGAQYAFSKAWRNLSGPMGLNFKNQIQNQIPGRDQTASRWSAPSPGKRTRREEHALSHRPQMSSGRLFLDSGWSPPEPVSASPARTDYHALPACHLKTGTFYFAGKRNFLLCLDTRNGSIKILTFPSTSNSVSGVPTPQKTGCRWRLWRLRIKARRVERE